MVAGDDPQQQGSPEAPLKQRLTGDLKEAMKAGDTTRRSVMRLVLAAIQNAEVARQEALDDSAVLSIIAKEIRQHKESIDAFRQGNRPDLVIREETELAILQAYMPEQVSREEIVAEALRVIAAVGALGPGDKGKVMPQLIARLKGKADGREVNAVVTELLAS